MQRTMKRTGEGAVGGGTEDTHAGALGSTTALAGRWAVGVTPLNAPPRSRSPTEQKLQKLLENIEMWIRQVYV